MRVERLACLGVACCGWLAVAGARTPAWAEESPAVAAARSPLVLVATMVETGQALVYDTEKRYFVLLEMDDVYRDHLVLGVGVDFMSVAAPKGGTIVLALTPGGTAGAPAPRTASPSVKIATSTIPKPPPPAPSVVFTPEPGAAPPPAAAPAPGVPRGPIVGSSGGVTILPEIEIGLEGEAAPGTPGAVPPPPAPPAPKPPKAAPPTTLSMSGVREEVASAIAGARPYRAEPVEGGGYRVSHVDGTALERMGLVDGDVIVALNGVKLTSRTAAMRAYAEMHAASAVDVSLLRDGAPLALKYKLVP